MTRKIAFDTETTGLNKSKDRIVEMGAQEFSVQPFGFGKSYHQYISPGIPIPAEVSKVHGISDEMVKDKPKFADIVDSFLEFIKGSVLVIHNANFDEGMVDAELKRLKKGKLRDYVLGIEDTLAYARSVYTVAQGRTLDALCNRYEVDLSQRTTHGALLDCQLLAQVYPGLYQDYLHYISPIVNILGFDPRQEPEDFNVLLSQTLKLQKTVAFLTKFCKNRQEIVKTTLDGKEYTGGGAQVSYSPSITTDWKKVKKDYLEAIDLKEYQKSSLRMKIREQGDEEDSDESE